MPLWCTKTALLITELTAFYSCAYNGVLCCLEQMVCKHMW